MNSKALIDEIALQEAISFNLAKKHLSHFTELFWHHIEPGSKYVQGWHIDAISEHLEAAAHFEIKKLLICMPPRHMKSIKVGVMFPSWVWASQPTRRFVTASYADALALRDSIKMRDIITSEDYIKAFDLRWELRHDQNQKRRFENTAGGFRFTTSVNGTMTGEGGDYLIIDDPHNAKEAHSQVARDNVKNWWKTVMSTRANDPKQNSKIVVMQRLHGDDLAGELLSQGDWDSLILPAEYKPKTISYRSKSSLGWVDPRSEENELLWPERYDAKSIAALKKDLGSMDAQSQLQQDPIAISGGTFKRHWWVMSDKPPADILKIVQFYDTAQKPGVTNDYSVCATWALTSSGYYILDVWRKKLETPDLQAALNSNYHIWQPNSIVIEDKSSGSALIQYLRRETRLPVLPYNPGKLDKTTRALAVTSTVEAGRVTIPKGAKWLDDFLLEHEQFPLGVNDDMVDTTSMAIDYFQKTNTQIRVRSL